MLNVHVPRTIHLLDLTKVDSLNTHNTILAKSEMLPAKVMPLKGVSDILWGQRLRQIYSLIASQIFAVYRVTHGL